MWQERKCGRVGTFWGVGVGWGGESGERGDRGWGGMGVLGGGGGLKFFVIFR